MKLGEPVTFGSEGTAQDYALSGIDFGETGPRSWTVRPFVELYLPIPLPRQDLRFELEVAPFLHLPDVPHQQVFIYLNGLFQIFETIRGAAKIEFSVPGSIVASRRTRLSLVIPTAMAPKRLGLNSDERELGLALSSILLDRR